MTDFDYGCEFDKHLQMTIRQYINFLCWVSLITGRLKQEIAAMSDVFPDSTRLTDFACEECGNVLARHFKHGEPGYDFFGCSGCLVGCTALYDANDGMPVRRSGSATVH